MLGSTLKADATTDITVYTLHNFEVESWQKDLLQRRDRLGRGGGDGSGRSSFGAMSLADPA